MWVHAEKQNGGITQKCTQIDQTPPHYGLGRCWLLNLPMHQLRGTRRGKGTTSDLSQGALLAQRARHVPVHWSESLTRLRDKCQLSLSLCLCQTGMQVPIAHAQQNTCPHIHCRQKWQAGRLSSAQREHSHTSGVLILYDMIWCIS